jgi:hypothetical protein
MYYVGKILQAGGLTILCIGYMIRFPKLVDYKTFGISLLLFVTGWVITQYLVKR